MNDPANQPIGTGSATTLSRVLACAATCLTFVAVYNGTNYITAQRASAGESIRTAAFSWELLIPFVPIMIIPYWSIDLFFVAAPFFIRTKGELRTYVLRICSGIFFAGAFFLIFPLQLVFVRPEVAPPLSFLFGALDNFNNFFNLAPSLHIVLRTILWTVYIPRAGRVFRPVLQIWFFLIGLSTLLVYQHQIIDVFTGQLLGLLLIQLIPVSTELRGNPARRENARTDLACRYIAGALIFVVCAFIFGLPGIFFLWPAAALFTLGTAYLGLGPAVFAKRNGAIGTAGVILLLPYLIGRTLSYLFYTSGREAVSPAGPGVYFGRRISPAESGLLPPNLWAVLDLTAEFSEAGWLLEKTYCNIQVLDLTAPSLSQLTCAVEFIEKERSKGPVYVHCSLGLSRSALTVAAWLLKYGGAMDPQAALDQIRRLRPGVVLHPWHEQLFKEYASAPNSGQFEPEL